MSGRLPGIVQDAGWRPPEGNQPRPKAKTRMNNRPIQNVGRAEVVIDADTLRLSRMELRLLAETIPSTAPMLIPRMVDTPRSTRVFRSRPGAITCVEMGWPFW